MESIQLCDINKCTQCYACHNICPKQCINMKLSKDGFVIPVIDRNSCIQCGVCMKSCHIITPKVKFQTPIKNYACWTKNQKDRENSSSGGAFSVIARKVLEEEGIVFGATITEDLKIKHIAIETPKELILLQGSKYVQSFLGNTYDVVKKELKSGRKVLFTGTPCQVAGLITFLNKSYENLITCDIICHGVPSQISFDIYIDKINIKNRSIKFNFRFTKGWGFQLSRQDKKNYKHLIYPSDAYYLRAFNKGLMFSEACYKCFYARLERISDFTLADYWGLGLKIPFNHSIQKGISCLLINNKKALNFIRECSELEYEERPFEEIIAGNYNLTHSSKRPIGRDSYFEDTKRLKITQLIRKYKLQASWRDYLRLIKQSIISKL